MNAEVVRFNVSMEIACPMNLLYTILHLLCQVNHHRLINASRIFLLQLNILLDGVFQVLHNQVAPAVQLPMVLVLGQPIITSGINLQELRFCEQGGVLFSNWVKFDSPEFTIGNFLVQVHFTLRTFS